VTPRAEGEDPASGPAVDEELTLRMDSHLVRHSAAEGFDVPVDVDHLPLTRNGSAGAEPFDVLGFIAHR
jgi:hypothetical protein